MAAIVFPPKLNHAECMSQRNIMWQRIVDPNMVPSSGTHVVNLRSKQTDLPINVLKVSTHAKPT